MLAAVSAGAVAVFVSLVVGLAGSIQVAISGTFGRRIGVVEAAAFGAIFAALILVALVAVASRSLSGITSGLGQPPWLWLTGVMSAIVVVGITYAGPRIGTFATIALVIAAQLFMAVIIDAVGMFGLERIPLNWSRITGLVLLACGSALILKR
jgi:bacterial/archaeal transporter family-2 protein